jgi:hypothetical protein
VSLEDAARWATWLPPDAVTWIAVRERQEKSKPVTTGADGKPRISEEFKNLARARMKRREAELADMAEGGGDG